MDRLIKLSIAPATETHCGDRDGACHFGTYRVCLAYDGSFREYDETASAYRRLPACIAAEVKAEGRNS